MQQPALRLALLTFATMLVSGCAEQFAAHMAQSSAWTVVPVQTVPGKGEKRSGQPGSRQTTAAAFRSVGKQASLRLSWCQPTQEAARFDVAKLNAGAPAASSLAPARNDWRESPWEDGHKMSGSDYHRVRIG